MTIKKVPNIVKPDDYNIDILSSPDLNFLVDNAKITRMVRALCESLGVQHREICISFVSASKIAELNLLYRNIDRPTDVLSFPQEEWDSPLTVAVPLKEGVGAKRGPLGDAVISLDRADEQAQMIGHGLDREVSFLIVHGLLHLCGHDHMEKEEEAIMLAEQKKLMSLLAQDPKSPLWKDCVRKSVNSNEELNFQQV